MTKRLRLTGWFPASCLPTRKGYYEVRGPMIDAGTLMHFNGLFWGNWHAFPFGAGQHYIDHGFGAAKGDAWRGVRHTK
jgi:hypothetical protein